MSKQLYLSLLFIVVRMISCVPLVHTFKFSIVDLSQQNIACMELHMDSCNRLDDTVVSVLKFNSDGLLYGQNSLTELINSCSTVCSYNIM